MTDAAPTVGQAWSRVMAAVQGIAKNDRNTQQNFNFRGIDAVVNAVGPAMRAEGVFVVPIATAFEQERYSTKSGTQMKGVTVDIMFRVYGPAGDFFDGKAMGEASDSGDKAMPKAHSVAYRTFLLQALCIPTDEPDPDAESHDRAEVTVRDRMEEYANLHSLDIVGLSDDEAKAMLNQHAKAQKAAK